MKHAHVDGSAHVVIVRIGDVRQTHGGTANPWSAAVGILGFTVPESTRIRGRDRAEAIEDAARFAALRVADKVMAAGGTLDPPSRTAPVPPARTSSPALHPGQRCPPR